MSKSVAMHLEILASWTTSGCLQNLQMAEILESKLADRVLALKAMRTHARNLSWGGQGTPLSRKLSASPKVVSALASSTNLSHTHSLKPDVDVALDFRIAKYASGSLAINLLRVPEERLEANTSFLEAAFDKNADGCQLAAAAALVLPEEGIEIPIPGTPKRDAELVPVVVAHPQHSSFDIMEKGELGSFDYRIFLKEGEKVSSFWHDIPLDNGDGTVNFVCEIPKDTKAKMEVATKEGCTPIKQDIKKGRLREYPYNINWNYGMLPRTWEDPQHINKELGGIAQNFTQTAMINNATMQCTDKFKDLQGDNDPVDVVEIGTTQLESGSVYKIKVLGAYAMIDEGELDWKIIAICADDPLAPYLNDIEDVERRMQGVLENIMVWFRDYKIPDGKPANSFGYNNKAQSKQLADSVIDETHTFYQDLVEGRRENNEELALT